MKNLISCFALVALSKVVSAQLYTQKDTLRFAADSSYSRCIKRYNQTQLVFGTSKTGVKLYDEISKRSETIQAAVRGGEFRDIIVRNQCVYSMVSGDTGHVFRNCQLFPSKPVSDNGIFYDDIVFYKHRIIILGDPVDTNFFLQSIVWDNKTNCTIVAPKIKAFPGEACYAGSGTTAQIIGKNDYCFVSGGGRKARFHRFSLKDTASYFVRDLPMALGDGAGPFSVCFTTGKKGAIVGGNYLAPNDTTGTAVYSIDGGKNWLPAEKQPGGYRCCVTGNKRILFCAGSNGIDYSTDGGKTWNFFDKGYFCALLLEGNRLYATTNKGYCLRYQLNLTD